MSHYHAEIIMPPTTDVKTAVTQIMKQFDENDEESTRSAFWDWWVIGGRWSGQKVLDSLDEATLKEFHTRLRNEHVTVSSLQCGKHTLQPASQTAFVDALWAEFFPNCPERQCPLFDNYNGAYGDVMPLANIPTSLSAERIIFAGPTYDGSGLEAKHMLQRYFWNGCNHVKTTWDGSFAAAMTSFEEGIKHYRQEYADKLRPQPDWLVVTIDYHS